MFNKKKINTVDISKPVGTFSVKHILGLEIPQTSCRVAVYNDRILIISGITEYELQADSICSVDFEMNVDVERYLKTNLSRGIAGALAFGVTGAVIGSSLTNKVNRNVTCCATICYRIKTQEVAYLVFEDTVPNTKEAARLVDKVRPLIKQSQVKQKITL